MASGLGEIRIEGGADLPCGTTLYVNRPGFEVCLARVEDGRFFAVDDACSHGAASLADGFLDGIRIECPKHAGCFDLATGEAVGVPAVVPIRTYQVVVEGSDVVICADLQSVSRGGDSAAAKSSGPAKQQTVHAAAAPPRGRPMDPARGEALLRAAQHLLIECGYERLSMDAVAARAGASKSTLYRRWPSKSDLVVAALDAFEWDETVRDHGNLRLDLIGLAEVWFSADHHRDQLFMRMLTALPYDDRLYEFYQSRLAGPRAEAFAIIVTRAAQRGEICDLAAALELVGILPAMAFQQLLAHRSLVDRAFIEYVLDGILLPLMLTPSAIGSHTRPGFAPR